MGEGFYNLNLVLKFFKCSIKFNHDEYYVNYDRIILSLFNTPAT